MKTPAKIILVTGSNRGIGLELVRQLATMGHTVILSARDEAKGEKAAAQLTQQGLSIEFLPLDVSNEKSIHDAAALIKKKYDRLDVLINNAGILHGNASTLSVSKGSMEEHMATNFYGPMLLVQALLPLLKKSTDARIINFTTGMASLSSPGSGTAAYRLSKIALNGLTAILSADLQGTNIKVNSLDPGWVQTGMGGSSAPKTVSEGADTAVWLATADNIPSGKFFRNRKVTEW
jgi:NAD(P)-dependent dehydrogenase (short-subunit alcohol dehydrogenase family)